MLKKKQIIIKIIIIMFKTATKKVKRSLVQLVAMLPMLIIWSVLILIMVVKVIILPSSPINFSLNKEIIQIKNLM